MRHTKGHSIARPTRWELKEARAAQKRLLPGAVPFLPGYRFSQVYKPARQVGGDYYDYLRLSDGRLIVALGDVSGKGIPAALVMARFSAEARQCLASSSSQVDAITELNAIFCDDFDSDKFVTFVAAALDVVRHELCLVNAGHPYPLICRASGEIQEVGRGANGLPLGVDPRARFDCHLVLLEPGDHLLLYTDGVPDAVNGEGERYGIERLKARFAARAGRCGNVAQDIFRDVLHFAGRAAQADDMCMTAMHRLW